MTRYRVELGDCRDVLRQLAAQSVDAVVTDPPYEIGFMGRSWDAGGVAFDVELWREALRVLKPGGHLLAFGATRAWHRLAVAVEDAGFEIRDTFAWLRGGASMPKGLDVSKAIDKALGARGHEGRNARVDGGVGTAGYRFDWQSYKRPPAVTPEARAWLGWHTATKPMFEPVVVARRPLDGTVVENVLAQGVGAYHVDACRVGDEQRVNPPAANKPGGTSLHLSVRGMPADAQPTAAVGRWPPNVLFGHAPACEPERCVDDCAVAELEAQRPGAGRIFPAFRYALRPKKAERHGGARNTHPTVKPVALMRYLVRLVTPRGGVVLDPFTGSGTTGMACVLEGARFIGCELSADFRQLALARIAHAERKAAGEQLDLFDDEGEP